MEQGLAEAVVWSDEDVRAVAARDRRLELREVGLVRDGEHRHLHTALRLEAQRDLLQRRLLTTAVRVPEDDSSRRLGAARQEHERDQRDEHHERAEVLHARLIQGSSQRAVGRGVEEVNRARCDAKRDHRPRLHRARIGSVEPRNDRGPARGEPAVRERLRAERLDDLDL